MYHVEFPSLGITFNVNRTAFQIGSFSVQWYGILIAVGVLLAFLYAMRSCKKFRLDEDRLIDAVLVGLVGGIIGARLYYVLFYPGSRYLDNPLEIFALRDGGLGIYGGVIGGLLCGALMAKFRKLKVGAVLDLASLGFLIGQCIGRWGNFVNQEAFGVETDLPWGMSSEATAAVASGPVHPCFLYESLWCLLGFVLLHMFSRKLRRYDGQGLLGYVIWYGVGCFFIEGLRTDSLITPFLVLRVSQLVAAASVLAAAVLLVVFRKRTSLSGCGSRKVMALNGITDEEPEEDIMESQSTLFEDMAVGDVLREEHGAEAAAVAQAGAAEEAPEDGAQEPLPEGEEEKDGPAEAPAPETAADGAGDDGGIERAEEEEKWQN